MTPELQTIIDALGPYGAQLVKWASLLFALRIAVKPVSGWIQQSIERALSRVGDTTDPDDDRIASGILRSKPYRFIAFLIDMVFSVKLPLELSPEKLDPPAAFRVE